MFEKMGRAHTINDRRVSWDDVRLRQKRVTGLCRGIAKAFSVGENWGQRNIQRCKDSYHTLSGISPTFTVMPKDHKDMVGGIPKDRPLCKASSGSCMNGRLSDLLTDLLTPVAREKGKHTCRSTEGMLNHIEKANIKLRTTGKKKKFILASQDVKALYPSLEMGKSSEIVRNVIEMSNVEFAGVDMDWVLLVIAM